jgi:hypothetical protein
VPRSADEPKRKIRSGDPKSGLPSMIRRSPHMTTKATGKLAVGDRGDALCYPSVVCRIGKTGHELASPC